MNYENTICWRLSKKRGFEVSSFYETLESLHWLTIDILRIKEEKVNIVSCLENFNYYLFVYLGCIGWWWLWLKCLQVKKGDLIIMTMVRFCGLLLSVLCGLAWREINYCIWSRDLLFYIVFFWFKFLVNTTFKKMKPIETNMDVKY